MLSIITIPSNFTDSTTANASAFFSDLAPITTLVVGVMLAATAIYLILGFFRR